MCKSQLFVLVIITDRKGRSCVEEFTYVFHCNKLVGIKVTNQYVHNDCDKSSLQKFGARKSLYPYLCLLSKNYITSVEIRIDLTIDVKIINIVIW